MLFRLLIKKKVKRGMPRSPVLIGGETPTGRKGDNKEFPENVEGS